MANNQRWNQPLSRWKEYYETWMASPDEEALAFCNVFFDQRAVYGDASLLEELKQHIVNLQVKHQTFAPHMALNIIRYKIPVGLFGKIVGESTSSGTQACNIKEAMLSIVTFARLYSLCHSIAAVNTFERLACLYSDDILQEESHQAITQAFSFLMGLRYKHQAAMLKKGAKADNVIDPAALSPIEKSMLKNAFSQISLIQKKVSYEFHLPA